ncbi:hypothetical protein DITRI_Ditri10aG0109000 [Diplodiscus trichospermus]
MASSSMQAEVCDSGIQNWWKLFKAPSNHSLEYFPLQIFNGKPVVTPPTEIFVEGEGLWKNAVVAQFIGQIPNFSLFQRLVRVMWNFGGEVEISLLDLICMSSLDFDLAKIPIRMHLRNVPLELFTRSGLSYIASAVGIPLYMDRITASYQRLVYA